MKKLLWIGDAVQKTGFARVTHSVLATLRERYDVSVLGINYHGDPHDYPYPIYPAVLGGDPFGVGRVRELVSRVRPDVIVINNDPWNIAPFLNEIGEAAPVIAYMPVDGHNCGFGKTLNGLASAICYTDFGLKELRLSGYQGPAIVVPHGVDADTFTPGDQAAARTRLKLDTLQKPGHPTPFIVLNINRNSPRKRLDLTVQVWTKWWNSLGSPRHVHLFLHCSTQKDEGWNLLQLARYFGMTAQLVVTNPNMRPGEGCSDETLADIYRASDVQITTTDGEGWGLTQHEGMACGIPQIVPEYAALGEWARGGVRYVDVGHYHARPHNLNTLGATPDVDQMVAALTELYEQPERRAQLGAEARRVATQPQFHWPTIAGQFDTLIQQVLAERAVSAPVGV